MSAPGKLSPRQALGTLVTFVLAGWFIVAVIAFAVGGAADFFGALR